MTSSNQHGNLVLTRRSHRELDLGYVGVIGIGGGAQLADGHHLAGALGDLHEELVRITDGVGLAIALEEAHHKAHGAADTGRILPVPLHLAVGGQQIFPSDVLQQGVTGLRQGEGFGKIIKNKRFIFPTSGASEGCVMAASVTRPATETETTSMPPHVQAS